MFCLGCLHLLVIGREKPIIPETPKPKKTNGSRADQTGYNYNGLHTTNIKHKHKHKHMTWANEMSLKAVALISSFSGDNNVRGSIHFVQETNGLTLSLLFLLWYSILHNFIYIYIYRVNNNNPCEREDNRALTRPPWLPYSRPWWHH